MLKHALIACLSTGMTSAFAVEIPQVRNHAPTVVGVNVSFEAGDNTPTLAAAAFVEMEMPCSAVATHCPCASSVVLVIIRRLSHHQLLLSVLLSHTTHAFVSSLPSPSRGTTTMFNTVPQRGGLGSCTGGGGATRRREGRIVLARCDGREQRRRLRRIVQGCLCDGRRGRVRCQWVR